MASSLPQRKLGKTGIKGTALGFGCMSLSPGFYSSDVDTSQTAKTLKRALELGASYLSTADFYSGFQPDDKLYSNLQVIGSVIKDSNFKPVIAMKWGPWIEPGKGFQPPDLSPQGSRKRVEKALEVLGVSSIDVLILRGINTSFPIPLEEIAQGMKALLDEGKIKAVGVSELSIEEIKTVHKVVPVSAIELECSLFARDGFKAVVPLAREIGASILAYSPLGRGLLADNFDPNTLPDDDFRKKGQPRFSTENLSNNQKLALRVKELAGKKGCTSSQLALAWVLAQGDNFIPIPGTKRIKNLEENFGALNVQLSKSEIEELSSIIPEEEVAGNRY